MSALTTELELPTFMCLQALREQPGRRGPLVIRTRHRRLPQKAEYDVCVCGGTLGIFIATTLQKRGFNVCVLEKNKLKGRTQEWNVNGHELQASLSSVSGRKLGS